MENAFSKQIRRLEYLNQKQMETFEKTLEEKEQELDRLRTELASLEGKYDQLDIENKNWNSKFTRL